MSKRGDLYREALGLPIPCICGHPEIPGKHGPQECRTEHNPLAPVVAIRCELCGDPHPSTSHDTEIVEWINADDHNGGTNGRAYYAYKRREKTNYEGFRKDVWWMMHNPVHLW